MSSFPLPDGICREVCRPTRSVPRVVKINDVLRFARAAVRNGEDPCAIASAVIRAVHCDPCGAELEDVVTGRDNLAEAWKAVRDALATLMEIVGLSILAEGLRDDTLPDIDPDDLPGTSWWRSFWRRWIPIIRAGRFLVAVYELIAALLRYNSALKAFLESLSDYFACLDEVKQND